MSERLYESLKSDLSLSDWQKWRGWRSSGKCVCCARRRERARFRVQKLTTIFSFFGSLTVTHHFSPLLGFLFPSFVAFSFSLLFAFKCWLNIFFRNSTQNSVMWNVTTFIALPMWERCGVKYKLDSSPRKTLSINSCTSESVKLRLLIATNRYGTKKEKQAQHRYCSCECIVRRATRSSSRIDFRNLPLKENWVKI